MKPFLLSLLTSIILILSVFSCNEADVRPQQELVNHTLNFNLNEIIDLYSHATGKSSDARITLDEIPEFNDMVFEIKVEKSIDGPEPGGGYSFFIIDTIYYSYEALRQTEIITLSLDPAAYYAIEIMGIYMLNNSELERALDDGLITRQIDISNSIDNNAPIDTTVTVLDDQFASYGFAFGKHNLCHIFGLTTSLFSPTPSDTTSINLSNSTLAGPRIFDITVNNSSNESLPGEIIFEIDGYNSDALSININSIPDELLIAYDNIERIELFYLSPTNVKTSLAIKNSGFRGYDLVFFTLNLNIPTVEVDENGEYVSSTNPGGKPLNIFFSGESLYEQDTINLGN